MLKIKYLTPYGPVAPAPQQATLTNSYHRNSSFIFPPHTRILSEMPINWIQLKPTNGPSFSRQMDAIIQTYVESEVDGAARAVRYLRTVHRRLLPRRRRQHLYR